MMLSASRSWKQPSELHQNHTRLADAVIRGNPEEAVQALGAHIQVGLESELAAL